MARTNLLLLLYLLAVAASGSASPCRCFPGDPCWPNESEWASFNASVGGNLIATSPIASTCHTDTWFVPYNRQACADLRGNWNNPATHYETSSSPMEPWFTNFSCSPFTEPSTPCTIGPLIRYAVKVSSATDVERSLKFAKEHNIRLVIRNTGHDYLGKSTGAGSLALWTHHYKPIEHIQQYNSSWYTGPALRIGAGVQGFDALDAAHALNLTLVTGNCPTIGLAGGFTQGGGVGQLSSRFGLAADQVLEWEVVTADGKILTVSPSNNADLFWALSGGGGGTFGVVLSVVVRLHPEMATASATLQFTGAAGSIDALFWTVLETFLVDTLPLLDAGGVSVWSILPTPGSEALTFSVAPLVLPGGTVEQLNGHMASTLDMLQRYNTSYSYRVKDFPTFYDSYSNTTPIVNVSEVYLGGRLIPRSTIATHPSGLIEALHSIARQGAAISGLALNTSHVPAFPNAVNPSWRETGMSIILGLPVDHINWQVNLDRQQRVTRDLVPTLAAFANADSAYLNEADFNDPYWQSAFYGINFDRLQMIKNKYDPDQLFYARTAVGSQRWEEKLDGRLCMVDPGHQYNSTYLHATPAAPATTLTSLTSLTTVTTTSAHCSALPKMAIKLLIISSRKAGLSPEEFKEHYENHARLIKRLAGDTFPLSHRRTYIARTTTNTPTPPAGATPLNPTTPASVLRGMQAQFDFDATAELTFESQAAYDRFVARVQQPEIAAQISADEERFLETSTVGIAMVGDVTDTAR